MSGISGPCDQPCVMGKHHLPTCRNYIDVSETCPCPDCEERRTVIELAADMIVPPSSLQPHEAFAIAEYLVIEGWEKR